MHIRIWSVMSVKHRHPAFTRETYIGPRNVKISLNKHLVECCEPDTGVELPYDKEI